MGRRNSKVYGAGRTGFDGVRFEDDEQGVQGAQCGRGRAVWFGIGRGIGIVLGILMTLVLGYMTNVIFKVLPYPPDGGVPARHAPPRLEDEDEGAGGQTTDFNQQAKGATNQDDDR